MRVGGHHENLVAGKRNPTVRPGNGVADEPRGRGALVMPDLASAAGIERIALVGVGHIHYPAGDDGGRLHRPDVVHGKDPLRLYFLNIGVGDLLEVAVAAPGRLTVVSGPIGLRGYL